MGILNILDIIPKITNQWLQRHNQIDYVGSTTNLEIDVIKAEILSSKQLSLHICDSSIIKSDSHYLILNFPFIQTIKIA
jgi:hypothetical protein